MEYRNQHFITEAYLKAWCDPNTPNNGVFLWAVSKKNRNIQRKSPKSLFSEDNFYTLYDSSGDRNIELEIKLKEIEDKFLLLRSDKLANHKSLTPDDRLTLALFISSTFARTKHQKEEGVKIWQDYIEMVDSLPPEWFSFVKQTKEYKQVEEIHSKQPMLFHLHNFVNLTAPYLFLMNCAVFETNLKPGIITSDNPCFWFDPAIYNSFTPKPWFGLGSPTLNILFPISPQQYVSLEKGGLDGYFDLGENPHEEEIIDVINGFTATNCDEYIVVSQKTIKEKWFDE